jgi:tetratricopeptide (TPR) repeat protein
MKKILLTFAGIFIITCVSGQDLVKKISLQICSCLDTIESMDSLEAKLDRCVPEAFLMYFQTDAEEDENEFFDSDTIKKTMDEVVRQLGSYCPKIRKFVLADHEAKFYRNSDSQAANDAYDKADKAFKSGDYKSAEKYYNQALKADPLFVFAWDDLALTCRKTGDYKKAVKYYNKSLEIYPEGSYALQNQAVAYTYLKEYDNALKNYDLLTSLYPDNPEGFFGEAKIYILKQDFETALDYAFYTHKMYVNQKSDYVKDTESMILQIHEKMKEQNKLDVFNRKADEFGVKVN